MTAGAAEFETTSEGASALEFRAAVVQRKGRVLLGPVDLRIDRGSCVAVVGPNGAGKTTLLQAALGLNRLTSGEVLASGARLDRLPPRRRAACVAYLPQHLAFTEALPVLDFVAVARFRFGEAAHVAEQHAAEALARVGLAALARRKVTELSGGERQRVLFASLLAQAAPTLLLDEPGNHLDPAQQIELYRLLGRAWRSGSTVVCVTHDINLLAQLGEAANVRVLGIGAGRVVFDRSLADPSLPEALRELFGIHWHVLEAQGERVFLPRAAGRADS